MPSDLASKLQLKSDQSLLVINAPVEHAPELDEISLTNAVPASAVLVFVTQLEKVPDLLQQGIASILRYVDKGDTAFFTAPHHGKISRKL